jgi:hypothetical protein
LLRGGGGLAKGGDGNVDSQPSREEGRERARAGRGGGGENEVAMRVRVFDSERERRRRSRTKKGIMKYWMWNWNCEGGKLQPATTCWRSVSSGTSLFKNLARHGACCTNCCCTHSHAAVSSRSMSSKPAFGSRRRKRQSGTWVSVGMTLRWHGESAKISSNTSMSSVCLRIDICAGKGTFATP